MRSNRLVLLSLLGSLALGGCDTFTLNVPSETPSAAPTPTYEAPSTYAWDSACELLQGVDAAALLDEPVGTPYVSRPSRCQMEGSATSSTAAVELYITSPGGAADLDYQKQIKRGGVDVPGLGDAAFQAGGYLHVLVGDNELSLVVIRSLGHDSVTSAELVGAARTVLANTGW